MNNILFATYTYTYSVAKFFLTSISASFTLDLKSPQNVHIGVNEKLELNCTSNRPILDLRPAKLLWQHNNVWIPNNTYVVDDYTVQLKITKTSYGDAGCYSCGLFNISSNSHSTNSGYSQNVTVIVGGMLLLV